MEAEGADLPAFACPGSNRVNQVRFEPAASAAESGRVWINGEQYFEGVALETWEFGIGGYRPAERWLKDRKKRTLAFDEIDHYRHICGALAATAGIMRRIEEVIEARGGWPLVSGS